MAVNTYETLFILEPEASPEVVEQLITKQKQAIAAHEGTITNEDRWGRRRLAYPIQGHREGHYVILNFTGNPKVISDLDHLYRVNDKVIRHLTIRVIKKNKVFRPRRVKPAADATRPPTRPTTTPMTTPAAQAPSAPATPPPSTAATTPTLGSQLAS